MAQINELMKKVFERCDVVLDEEIISRELLVKTFAEFIFSTSGKEAHNVGLVLHTGSPVFDAVAVAYAAISNMVLNELDSDEIINSLCLGDLVLYNGKRYTYEGKMKFDPNDKFERIKLTQGSGFVEYVPPALWRKITPYNGESTRLDGRGIRKKKNKLREEFYSSVLDIPAKDIPSVIDTSTVLVMSRSRADRIIKGLSFIFDGKTIPLLELVTASYFTENEEFCYGGNTAKSEAVLKICGKASVASSLIRVRNGNRHIGVIVMGSGTVTRNYTELPEIINRRSLQYVYILIHIDSDHGISLLNQCEGAQLFACTADFLRAYSDKPKVKRSICTELARQVDAIIEHRNEPVTLEGHIDWSMYKSFKRALLSIKHSDYTGEAKDQFVIQAYSLMNLLLTSVFPISAMEQLIKEGKINILSPSDRFDELCGLAKEFPDSLKKKAQTVTDIIEELYLVCSERSVKGEQLCKILAQHHNKHIALVIPKAYYADIIEYIELRACMDNPENLVISTANKFDNSLVYDLVIAVGDFCGSKFDAFRCRSAKHVITLLYEFESNIFKFKMKKSQEAERLFNQHAVMDYHTKSGIETIYYEDNATDAEVQDMQDISAEIDDYVSHLNSIAAVKDVSFYVGNSVAVSEAVAVATFETGEKALFTKMYKAYVFDHNSGDVNEVEVNNLGEGDYLVFTKYDDEARDVVDNVLKKLVENRKVNASIVEAYHKSKKWKSALIRYMNKTGYSEQAIADTMIKNGVSVTEPTIRRWLDEDARIVGPRDSSSIQQIALLIEDDEMFTNYEAYHEACSLVKRVRNDIRKEIGKVIIAKLQGQTPTVRSTIISDIYDRIDSMAQILRLESITFIKHTVPIAAVNKPFKVKE